MIGAIIGDIVGSVYEFNNTSDYNFPLFSEYSSYTDDTICTIAVADAILHNRSYQDSLQRWCRQYPTPMGSYGGSFAGWIHEENPKPYGSFGNGSAMRVSPVGWAFDNREEVMLQARLTALPTHNHPEGVKGAETVAVAIFELRKNFNHSEPLKKSIIEKIGEEFYPGFQTRHFPKGKFDETCMGTVPLAFQILLEAESFEDAIRKAVAHGGDSDTLADIVGGIAEACFGVPDPLKSKALTYLPTAMQQVVNEFIANYG